jgi:hypothetical protein
MVDGSTSLEYHFWAPMTRGRPKDTFRLLQMARGGSTKDQMAIIEGITAAKAALDVSKLLTDLLNRPDVNVADVRGKVNELLIHVVNAQVALGEAQVELGDLRNQLADKEALKALEADIEFEQDGNFWVRKSERQSGLIPYCPACWGEKRKLVAMAPYSRPGVFRCPLHEKTAYTTSVYTEWQKKQPQQPRVVHSNWLQRG